jgi:uncharacterized membrane protein
LSSFNANAYHSRIETGTAVMTKTLSFALMHFSIAFALAYALTGSVLVGGTLALIEPAVNTVAFHFHERLWSRLQAAGLRPLPVALAGAGRRRAAA